MENWIKKIVNKQRGEYALVFGNRRDFLAAFKGLRTIGIISDWKSVPTITIAENKWKSGYYILMVGRRYRFWGDTDFLDREHAQTQRFFYEDSVKISFENDNCCDFLKLLEG